MRSPAFARLAASVFVAALSSWLPAHAQAKLHEIAGSSPQDGLGSSVAGVGDVDGDGIPDFASGAPSQAGAAGQQSGAVRVWSGRSGALLLVSTGNSPGALYGTAVAAAGDVDGDGMGDVIAGAPAHAVAGDEVGEARVFSGANGATLWSFVGPTADADFGFAVAGAGDVDGDLVPDLIVGAYEDDWNGDESGSAYVYSGASGAVLHRFDGDEPGVWFGYAVAGAGDVNGDGRADLLVGAPHASYFAGAAHVFSGLDGSILRSFLGRGLHGSYLGYAVRGMGDLDGDGRGDLAIGEPGYSPASIAQGRVRVYSGRTGAVLREIVGRNRREYLGVSVSSVDDATGDGVPDLVVGTLYSEDLFVPTGWAFVYPGVAGPPAVTLESNQDDDRFGNAVAGVGDVNGDGLSDFVVGASALGTRNAGHGAVRLYLSGCPEPERYCYAGANSTGIGARLAHAGGPSIVVNNLSLVVSDAPPGQLGLFFYGSTAAQTPFGDGFLCVGGAAFRLNPPAQVDAGGTATRLVDFTAPPAGGGPGEILPGSTWNFQFRYRDPSGPLGTGFNYSDAMRATFCP